MNSASSDLDLKDGAVAKSLLAKGGQGLQDECKTRYPQGIQNDQVAETKGHGLKCRAVYHLSLCQWSNQQAGQVFQNPSSQHIDRRENGTKRLEENRTKPIYKKICPRFEWERGTKKTCEENLTHRT